MMLLKADERTEAGEPPDEKLLVAMGKYNAELIRAGILLAADGLRPSAIGTRVCYRDGRRTIIDGPFAGSKELIAGFWMIQVKSRDEAIQWALRIPFEAGERPSAATRDAQVEVRQVFEPADFSAGIRATEERRAVEEREHEFRNRADAPRSRPGN